MRDIAGPKGRDDWRREIEEPQPDVIDLIKKFEIKISIVQLIPVPITQSPRLICVISYCRRCSPDFTLRPTLFLHTPGICTSLSQYSTSVRFHALVSMRVCVCSNALQSCLVGGVGRAYALRS